MICDICGSSDFALHEGILYCTECNTQIKETLDEQTDEVNFSRRSLLSGSSRSPTDSLKKDKTKKFAPWITIEGYNVLLCKQVSALMKLGASSNLQKTVLYIWSRYLERCEIAFRADYRAHEGVPRLGPFPNRRDISVLYGDKSLTFSSKKWKKSQSETEGVSDSEINLTESESDTSRSSSSKKNYYKFSSHAKKFLKKLGKKSKHTKARYKEQVPCQMSLPKTLCFCYLSLLYCEDNLSLTDLIRFVYEDRIPYLNALDAISPPLEVVGHDFSTFVTYQVPDHYLLLKICSMMFEFLELPDFKRPPVMLATARIIRDLNLPDDLMLVVKGLHKIFEEKTPKSSWRWFPSDVDAYVLIIVALKVLFVLDGNFEIEHSEIMVKLNTLSEDKYFVWTKWKEWAALVEYLFLPESVEYSYSAVNKFDSLSADCIISMFPHLDLSDSEDNLFSKSRTQQYHDRAKKGISKLLSGLANIAETPNSVPSSFPLRTRVKLFENEWRTLPMFKETASIDFSFLKQDFSSHSLAFNPQDTSPEDEIRYLLLTSLYVPEEILHVEKRSCYKKSILRTSSDYWTLNNSRELSISKELPVLKQVPSWLWLVTLMSKYSKISVIALRQDAVRIEKLLFCKGSDIPEDSDD